MGWGFLQWFDQNYDEYLDYISFNRLEINVAKKTMDFIAQSTPKSTSGDDSKKSPDISKIEELSSPEISLNIEDDSSGPAINAESSAGASVVLLSDDSSILSAAGDLDLDQPIDILVNQSDLDETILMDRWINTNEIMKQMQDRYTQWTSEEAPILKFKIMIGSVPFYIFFDKSGQSIKALVSIREDVPVQYSDSIIKCRIESDYVYLQAFFYFSDHGDKKKIKPSREEVLQNLFKNLFQVPSGSIPSNLSDMTPKALCDIVKQQTKFDLSAEDFEDITKQDRHFISIGQRGMRLVKIIKEITQKNSVRLQDAWYGKWSERSEDMYFFYTFCDQRHKAMKYITELPNILRSFRSTQYEDIEDTCKRTSNMVHHYIDYCRNEIENLKRFPKEALDHYCARYAQNEPLFLKMRDNGYYGQYGFKKELMSNLYISEMNDGDVTQIEYKGASVQCRFHAR